MRAMRLLSLLVVAGFLALPVSAQDDLKPGIYNPYGSTPTTMWFHINGFQDFPINTQPPDDRYAETPRFGVASHSGCFYVEGNSIAGQSRHTWYGYSSPSYVEYGYLDEDGKSARIHKERGISFDVELDTEVKPVLTWWLEAAWVNPVDATTSQINSIPTVLPNVVVRGTIREGDDISPNHERLNTGAIIARGQTQPVVLAGPLTPANPHIEHVEYNQKHLYKITLPLEFGETNGRINKDESYNIRIDAFIENPYCDDPGADGGDYVMLDYIRVHTSPGHRPMLTWNVMNPLRIEYLHPQFIGDDLVIHTSTNSPWGNYDVRGDRPEVEGEALKVEISGPTKPISIARAALTARYHEHDHHTEAVDATWIWEYKKDGAQKGEYRVVFSAVNDQERPESRAVAVALFDIGTGRVQGCGGQVKGGGQTDCLDEIDADGRTAPGEGAPGIGALAGLGLLAAAGVAARRRP